MAFNGGKFQLIRLGNNEDIKEETNLFTNNMEGILEPTEAVKDLGVMVDNQANLKTHREQTIIKAKKKQVEY